MRLSEVKLPAYAQPLFEAHRYKSLWGGRGAAKSWTVATVLLIIGMQRRIRVLCARELQNSIKDSVHRLLSDRVQQYGWPYDTTRDEIRGANGTLFIFEGIRHNVGKIKSLEGIDICWVEEAQAISEESWEVLVPTIRKPSSEIWLTWNTSEEDAPTHKRFVTAPPPGCWARKVGWQDNPWLSPELVVEKDHLYATDPDAADHVWGGEPLKYGNAQILRGRYVVQSFEPGKDWHGPYQGLDFGFATTPLSFTRSWVHGRKLYIEWEVSGYEIDNDDMPARLDKIPDARKYTTRADCSRPETISHLRRHGFTKVLPCHKWSGSVEDGVEHLRNYEQVVIHPRCELAVQQARLYSFKVDKLTGDVLPIIDERNDDTWDAVRYALEPIIRRGKPGKAPPPEKPKRRDYGSRPTAPVGWKGR